MILTIVTTLMSYFQIIKPLRGAARQQTDTRLTRYTWKCARKGNDFFSLSKRRILNSFVQMSVSAKKKKCKCACVLFKWPEVAACLLNHYQSHSPPSVTSPVSEGILVSAHTPWTRTRSSEPERGKKSFLRSSPQIYCIPWRGSRPVSPCFNFSSLKKAKRHSWSTPVCKRELQQS